jgi:two-component system OmpR family sensor kinase
MPLNPSLQGRLARYITILVTLGGLAAASIAYVQSYGDAHELQDAQLREVAHLVALNAPPAGSVVPPDEPAADPDDQTIVEVSGAFSKAMDLKAAASPGLSTVMFDGKEWRAAWQVLADGRKVVARQLTEARDETARHSALQTLLPLLTLIPVLIGLLAFVIRRTLAPVRQMGAMLDLAASADPIDLPAEGVPVEILPFVASINAMMQRLREAQQHQRRFIADAAHELRTPIAALSIQAENLSKIIAQGAANERMKALQDGLRRTKGLLEQLLSLSRIQDRVDELPTQPCDVMAVLREVVADLLPLTIAKNIDIGLTQSQPCQVLCAPFEMRTLLTNVLSNAIRHVTTGGQIDISVTSSNGQMALLVDDNGMGVPLDDLQHVFAPFYSSKDNAQEGTGLGLAIVKAIADRMGATVALGPRPLGVSGCRFTLQCRLALIE